MQTKVGFRKWFSFLLAGFVGQLAWAIENNYLNLYVFHVTDNTKFIPLMVALSAATATIVTLLMGALSDRVGKRKIFISLGYLIWGISIILFAFLDLKTFFGAINNVVFLSGVLIVIMDCVMTFFGSTANDAAFNAYVTDNTDTTNRGKVESSLSVLPLIAMIVVVVVGGIFINETSKRWDIFFYIFGGLTLVVGIACFFLLPNDNLKPNKEEPYIKNIFYGFRGKVVKENKKLYLTLLAFLAFNIGIQVFMPYLMIYVQEGLGIKDDNFTIALGSILVVASIITVIFGLFMDKIGKNKVVIPAVIVAIIGGIIMTFVRTLPFLIVGGIVLMSGYLVSTAVFGAKIRDYTPENQVGLFQGVRMVFVVLLPMVTGPYIGEAVSHINAQTYTNDYGELVIKPNEYIFLFTSIVMLFVAIPLFFLLREEKKDSEVKNEVVDNKDEQASN